jgi:hypothetical protein
MKVTSEILNVICELPEVTSEILEIIFKVPEIILLVLVSACSCRGRRTGRSLLKTDPLVVVHTVLGGHKYCNMK